MLALTRKHFPGRELDDQALIEATWLEQDQWQKMAVAVANGIVKAFKG
ncbi:MAG: hypothetical protein V7707_08185 [Motiliproteus sp.]